MRLHTGCHYNAGNWARFLGLALTLKRPDLFDVRTARRSPAPAEWHNATWLRSQRACVDAEALLGDDLDAIAARLDETVEPFRFYDELDFCERKLFVHFICVHNRANSVDNRPPMIRTEPNPDTVNVGALMTVQVPEGLGPGSVFPVDVPGRGACRVTVPPGVFAGQTFTLLHPDYVSN